VKDLSINAYSNNDRHENIEMDERRHVTRRVGIQLGTLLRRSLHKKIGSC